VLVPANYVTPGASATKKVNDYRYQGKEQKQMNQEARDMVHDEAADPGEKQQHGKGEPNEAAHETSNHFH
jgi:hypothetical protein